MQNFGRDLACMPSPSATRHKIETGANLRDAITEAGLTQAEFARRYTVSPSKLGNWIRGENYPDPFVLVRFCEQTGLTMDWIYRRRLLGVAYPLADALSRRTPAS